MKTMEFAPKTSEAGFLMYKTLIAIQFLTDEIREPEFKTFNEVVKKQVTRFALKTDKIVSITWTEENWLLFSTCLHQLILKSMDSPSPNSYKNVAELALFMHEITNHIALRFM